MMAWRRTLNILIRLLAITLLYSRPDWESGFLPEQIQMSGKSFPGKRYWTNWRMAENPNVQPLMNTDQNSSLKAAGFLRTKMKRYLEEEHWRHIKLFFYPLTCTYRVSWQSWVTNFINNELNHAQVLISGKYVKASSDEMKSAPYPTLELCRQLHWRN